MGAFQMKSVVLVIGLAVGAAGAGCGGSGTASDQPKAGANTSSSRASEGVAPDAKGIQTMTVKTAVVPDYLELAAHIEADPTRVVHVFAPTGGRITEMKVRPWQHVDKGQTLALLDSSDLARAVSDYHKALANNEVKQKQLSRADDLLAHHAIAEKDYQQAQADAQMAKAELEAAREQILVFGMDPEHATTQLRVSAPRSGVILDVGAAPGEYSKSLDAPMPLCTIANITTVWAVGDVYEKDLTAVKSGEEALVTLNAYPDEHLSGRVSVVSDTVDPVTRTLHLRVVLNNSSARIKPAMFGSIRLLRSTAQGVLVPTSAVIREGTEAYVFVAKGNGRYERRNVKLARSFDGSLEIQSGIAAGDTIVSEGALLLREGAQD
jgi:cobalt-zinc-cadmium efflux system membrane fusion protein